MSPDRVRSVIALAGAASAVARRAAIARVPGAVRAAAAVRRAAVAAHSAARRRPDAVLATVLLVGVLVMVLHWKSAPVEPRPVLREPPQQHALAGP